MKRILPSFIMCALLMLPASLSANDTASSLLSRVGVFCVGTVLTITTAIEWVKRNANNHTLKKGVAENRILYGLSPIVVAGMSATFYAAGPGFEKIQQLIAKTSS